MQIALVIDMRETELMVACRTIIDNHPLKPTILLESRALPIGDIIITDTRTNVDMLIIERKTLGDLSASIKDGRYTEQSYRLNGIAHPNHNIVYLIEGNLSQPTIFKQRFDKTTLYSAMFSINYYKGFSLMRSNTLEESAIIICNMVFKLLKDMDKQPYHTNLTNLTNTIIQEEETNQQQPSVKDYCDVVKRVKKENITKENISEIMLCQIPNISSITARAIMMKFKTLTNLVIAIQTDATCLDDIKTTLANGKSRKISHSCIHTIIDYLTADNNG